MIRLTLTLFAALSLGGCSTSYTWDAHQGPGRSITYTRHDHMSVDADKVAAVGDALTRASGDFAVGAARGYADYEYTHPIVYVQPSFIQPQPIYTQQTFHVTPFGGGYRVW